MNTILFERPIASRFQLNNKTEVKQTNKFTYLSETSNIHDKFHYQNNIMEQNNTHSMLKPISTRDEKKVTEESSKKADYGKSATAIVYNK
jgi:hypothetical protein